MTMNILISFAEENRETAEKLAFELLKNNRRGIRQVLPIENNRKNGPFRNDLFELDESNIFVFLVTQDAVDKDKYALHELQEAWDKKFREPKDFHIVYCELEPVDYSHLQFSEEAIKVRLDKDDLFYDLIKVLYEINQGMEIKQINEEMTLGKNAPIIPSQTPAPITCEWRAEHLELLIHPVNKAKSGDRDGRIANYEHLKCECDRLRNELFGNNAARRIYDSLDRYNQALAATFEELDVYRLGHAGVALRAAVNGARDILSDANNAELAGLLTSHELFARQDPKWNKYVQTASRANFDADLFKKHTKLGEQVTKLLQGFYPVIGEGIPKVLSELEEDVSDTVLEASIQCYGYWKSIENIVLALVEKTLEFASKEADVFSKVFLEASGKFAEDMAQETRQQLIKLGGAAVSAAIVAACAYGLAEIAGYSDMLFGWFKTAKEFLETIAKAKR